MNEEPRRYPGSRHVIPPAPEGGFRFEEVEWDSRPIRAVYNGEPVDFFTVGALAMALGRKRFTIQKWERNGTLPPSRFRNTRNQRIYPRSYIEGLVRIAMEEGLLPPRKGRILAETNFAARAYELAQECL